MSEFLFNFIGFTLLGAVAIVLIMGIYTLFKGGSTSKKYSNKLIDEVKTKNNLQTDQIIIGGFSQGCMITLQTGIKRRDTVNSIVGYSGRIISTEHLSKNIVSRPNIILMHGDLDQVVPIESLLEAKEFFGKNNYEIETKIFKHCEHRIPTEGSSLGLQFIKKHFDL